MPMIITPESPMGIELAKWNKPYTFQPFPKMLYKAQKRPDGITSVGESLDSLFGGIPGSADVFTRQCQRIVASEREERVALEEGWRETQAEALARAEAKDATLADYAAHRHYEDRLMSDAAKAEAKAADDATAEHVAEVPVKRGPGRPRKTE